jgi:hypothetical protein
MSLHTVPLELLSNIAGCLSCYDPHSPPRDLIALQSTSRYFNEALNCHLNPAVWCAAFRFRFDDQAVLRRNFRPAGRDYFDQLREYTVVLNTLRKQDVTDWEDESGTLRTIYAMLLDNNGKNRAQLESAGIDGVVMNWLVKRLWEGAENNDQWPRDNQWNVFVLWIMWMLTTPGKLQQEGQHQREYIVSLLMPFALNPYRYYQAEGPPSHFHFPLPSDPRAGTIVIPASVPSAHGPYPVYVQPSREASVPYFGSMAVLSPPPITTAAKLLYFARREILPLSIPPFLPRTRAEAPAAVGPSPTQEDFIEVNGHCGAAPPPCVRWDWHQDCRIVNGIRDDSDVDYSVNWDPDYWRRRLCGYAWRPQPKWRPGSVYKSGSMDGLWQGRLLVSVLRSFFRRHLISSVPFQFPVEDGMRHLMNQAQYPGLTKFTESSLGLTHQPLFMRLKEYHAVSTSSSPRHVPFPPPNPIPRQAPQQQTNDDASEWTDLSMRNAWFPGLLGNVSVWTNPHAVRGSLLYSKLDEPKNALVKVEGFAPSPHVPTSPYSTEQNVWLYKEFNRQLDKRLRKAAEKEGVEYTHQDSDECEMCHEREEAIKRGQMMDMQDHEEIANIYEKDWEAIDALFEGVGLGHDETNPESDSEMDIDDEEEEEEEESSEFICDANAEVAYGPSARPIRRATDRAKIKPCDGIQDIIFCGEVRLLLLTVLLQVSHFISNRLISVTPSHGTASHSTAASGHGTVSSESSDARYVLPALITPEIQN